MPDLSLMIPERQYTVLRAVEKPTSWDPTGFLFDLKPGDVVKVTVVPEEGDTENKGWVVAEHYEAGRPKKVGWIEETALELRLD